MITSLLLLLLVPREYIHIRIHIHIHVHIRVTLNFAHIAILLMKYYGSRPTAQSDDCSKQ
jgi:hypothetical protein